MKNFISVIIMLCMIGIIKYNNTYPIVYRANNTYLSGNIDIYSVDEDNISY